MRSNRAVESAGDTPTRRIEGGRDVPADAAGNWIWLADLARWESALDVSYGRTGFASRLGGHFKQVCSLELAGRSAPEDDRAVREWRLPYANERFDAVALHGTLGDLAVGRHGGGLVATLRGRLLEECRRVLRVDGCLYVADRNPLWHRRHVTGSASPAPLTGGRLRRQLRSAGFGRVHSYYTTPSLDAWRAAIPANARAAAAFESTGARTLSARIRQVAVRLGAHPLLYPSFLHIAYR